MVPSSDLIIRHEIATWQLNTERFPRYLSEEQANMLFEGGPGVEYFYPAVRVFKILNRVPTITWYIITCTGMRFLRVFFATAAEFVKISQLRFLVRPKAHVSCTLLVPLDFYFWVLC